MTKRFPQADFSLVADIPRGVRFTLGQLERYDISSRSLDGRTGLDQAGESPSPHQDGESVTDPFPTN